MQGFDTVVTVSKHAKPANRNLIGLLSVAGLLYWYFTSKSK